VTDIQQGRYDALLRRVADLKGPGSKVNDVLEELFPMFDVENLPAELYVLGQIDLCFGGGVVANAAGVSGRGQIFNPAGSGKVITVTQAMVATTATAIIRWGRSNVALTTALQTQIFRDSRHSVGSIPTGQVRSQNSVALAPATGQTRLLANTPWSLEDENGLAVLLPGTGFEIGESTVLQDFHFTFYWRERVAEPSETNF